MSSEVFVALGANQGDREQNLIQSLRLLEENQIEVIRTSAIYETEPVGYFDQDWFLNAVVQLRTDLSPDEFLHLIRKVETKLGRERKIVNGPRTIDLDILIWGREIIESEDLIIPHPRLHQRLFVLRPLMDIGADLIHPGFGIPIRELFLQLKNTEQIRLFKPSFSPVPLQRPLQP